MIRVTRKGRILKAYGRVFRQEMERGVSTASLFLQGKIRAAITEKKLIDTGNLRGSIQVDIKRSPSTVVGIVGTNAPYALPLEMGIKKRFFPSNEMIEAITKWAKRKGIGATFGKTGKPSRSRKAINQQLVVGRAIAFKIARKGLDPKRFPSWFFRDATDEATPRIQEIIQEAFDRAAERAQLEGAR